KSPQEMATKAPVRIIQNAIILLRDNGSVRIRFRVIEMFFELGFDFGRDEMLHCIGVVVNVIGRDGHEIGQIQFPETMQANNLFCSFKTRWCKLPLTVFTGDESLSGETLQTRL